MTPPTCDYLLEAIPLNNTQSEFEFNFIGQNGSPNPSIVDWFIDGQTTSIGSGPSITYFFQNSGTYNVCANYEEPGTTCTGTKCTTVTVNYPNCEYEITSAQTAEAKAFVELMNSRATEYSDLAQQFQAKAKEATESVSASFK